MALANSLKTIQKLSTSHPYLFNLVKEQPIPHSVDAIAATMRDVPQLFNAVSSLRGSVAALQKAETPETYKIDWEFYKKNYPNPTFITELQSAYNDIDVSTLVVRPDFSSSLSSFFTEFEKNLKDLDFACKEVEALSDNIDAQIARLDSAASKFENMTIQEVAETYPEFAEEVEQELVDGAYGLEGLPKEEEHHGSHH